MNAPQGPEKIRSAPGIPPGPIADELGTAASDIALDLAEGNPLKAIVGGLLLAKLARRAFELGKEAGRKEARVASMN
jgi:hypothetical protein